jgi:hypothetical protein
MGKIISRLIPIEDMQELREKSCLEVQGDTSDRRDGSWNKTIGYDGGIGFREKAIWQFYTQRATCWVQCPE